MDNHRLYFIFFAIICLTASQAHSQPDTLWSARVSTTGNPVIYNAINHTSGDLILVGETNPGIATSNFLISRLSSSGSVMWTSTYGGLSSDAAQSCVEMLDGNLIVAGSGDGGSSVLLMAVSADGDSLWSRTYESGGLTGANDITLLQDGNVGVAGYRLGSDSLYPDLWLLKCDTNGDTIWTKTFGGSNADIGFRIRERQDRTLLISGSSRSNSAGDYDLWLLHTDSEGDTILSSSLYGGAGSDNGYGLSDGDSVVYICGKSTVESSSLGFIAKTDDNGDFLWAQGCTNGGAEEQLRGIIARRSGGTICAGWSGISWNGRQCWLFAANPDGSDDWHWVQGPAGSGFYGIIPVSIGGYLAYGQISESNVRKGYALRIFLSGISGSVVENETGVPIVGARVEIVGLPQYAITDQFGEYQLSLETGTYDVVVSEDCISRDTVMSVVVQEDLMIRTDFHVNRPQYVQFPSSISVLVSNHIQTSVPLNIANTGNGDMEFGINPQPLSPASNWLSAAPDTGLIPAGDTLTIQVAITADTTDNAIHEFSGSIQVITNSCPGNSVTIPVVAYVLDADDNPTAIPENFSLSAYPNPFNPNTTISFSVPNTARIGLSVYDITGRCVAVLANESFAPGAYQFPFDAGSLPSGLYFVNMESELFHSTRKIILIK